MKKITVEEIEAALPEMKKVTESLMDSELRVRLLDDIAALEREISCVRPKAICVERP